MLSGYCYHIEFFVRLDTLCNYDTVVREIGNLEFLWFNRIIVKI